MSPRSPLESLVQTPRRFGFDAAVRLLTLARRTEDPAEVAHFRSPPGLTYPPADVLEVRGTGRPDVTVGVMGLTGPTGVLPRHYTDAVVQALRGRSSSLHAFIDLLSHRFVAFFARAGAKYRPARAAETASLRTPPVDDPIAKVLLALTGHGTAHLTERMLISTDPLLHYAGLFAMRPRSAERLGAMVSDWLGMRVEVIEFAGAWLGLPVDQRTRVAAYGQFNRLSADAAIGVRAWDPQARIVLRIGPLDRAGFERLLPDREALHRLVALIRAYVGFEIGFAIAPVLAADRVPLLRLDALADPPPRLGWNTWLEPPVGGLRRIADADDPQFEAEIIEAQSIAGATKMRRAAAIGVAEGRAGIEPANGGKGIAPHRPEVAQPVLPRPGDILPRHDPSSRAIDPEVVAGTPSRAIPADDRPGAGMAAAGPLGTGPLGDEISEARSLATKERVP
jgi:type VI secretion system protein ImpH